MLRSSNCVKSKKPVLIWICFVLLNLFINPIFAQLSRKHYLPPLHSVEVTNVQEHYIYLSTFETDPFTVTITDGAGNPIEGSPFVISKGNHVRVQVGTSLSDSKLFVTEDELNTSITNKGLLLEARKMFYASLRTKQVAGVRAIHGGHRTCKGESALGNSFRIGSIPHAGNHGARNFFSSIMATEDNTSVTISDYNTDVEFFDVAGNIIDDALDIELNKGESYVVSGYTDIAANLDGFIGALVTSDKPIAVNTGNYAGGLSVAGSMDFGIDQIVPISDIGTEYIAIRGNGPNSLEQLIVVAANDNTDIFVNGSATAFNTAPLNAGDYLLIDADRYQGSANKNIYIATTEPAYLYQSLGGSSRVATTAFNFIPPITCFFLKEIEEIPDVRRIGDTEYGGNIAVVTTIGSDVSVNGVPTTAVAEAVLGNTEWETYRIDDLDGDVSVASTGPLSVAFYGTSENAGFSGYYSSFGLSPSGNTDVFLCNDDTVDLLEFVDEFPDPGGTWSPQLSSGTSVFDPLVDDFGVYSYILNTSCTTIDITITVGKRDTPTIEPDLIFNSCDTDNDGFSDYDLDSFKEVILDGQTDITVTFHETQVEAEGLQNQLSSPYTSDAKIIYVRLQDDLSDCVSIGTLELALGGSSQSGEIRYELCDSGDGTADFDLTSQIEIILGMATAVPVSFYVTETDAEDALNPINPSDLYNSSGETLYTRIDNSDSCFSIGTLELIIGDGPRLVEDLVYAVCDHDLDGDATNGLVDFDLDSQIDIILDGQTAINVTFYTSESDAENELNPLVSPYNSENTILYTRLERDTCHTIGQLELQVNPAPEIVTGLTYSICDDDRDGAVDFDLDTQRDIILNGQIEVNVTFYESKVDAENFVNQLPNIFNSGDTVLFTRLESEVTNCYSIGELALSINGGVEVATSVRYELCDTDGDGFSDFDLTSQVDMISNGGVDVTVSFYTSQVDADNGTDAIDTAVLYNSPGETVFTRVENMNSCFSTGTLELALGDGPRVVENLVYELCDDTNNGLVDFDLDSQIDVIIDDQINVNVTFYESEADAEDALNSLTSPYNSGSTRLYTRLEQGADCFSIGELTLQVNTLPEIVSGLTYTLCGDDTGDLIDFDLSSQINTILNGQTDVEVTFYESETDAENDINAILSTSVSDNKTVYTRLIHENTACVSFGNIELLVENGPEVNLSKTYYICEGEENSLSIDATPINLGVYSYTWNPKNPNVDINGNELAVYTITQEGNYSVTISDQDTTLTCETIKDFEVIELTKPRIIDVLGASDLFIIGTSSTIEIVTNNVGLNEYRLNDGSWQNEPVFPNVGGGTHEVSVRDVNGCDFEDSKEFELILFRPFFTPNGDNSNDYWKIDDLPSEYQAQIYIYDRYGKLLKQQNPDGIGWDGTYNNKNMPSDDYWVLIEYTKDGTINHFRSHFSLKR